MYIFIHFTHLLTSLFLVCYVAVGTVCKNVEVIVESFILFMYHLNEVCLMMSN